METNSLTAYADAEAFNAALLSALLYPPFGSNSGAIRVPPGVPPVTVYSLQTRMGPNPWGWHPAPTAETNIGFKLLVAIFRIPVPLEIAAWVTSEHGKITVTNPIPRVPPIAQFQTAIDAVQSLTKSGSPPEDQTAPVLRAIVELLAPTLVDLVIGLAPIQIHELYGSDLKGTLQRVDVVPVGGDYMLRALAKLSRDARPSGAPLALRPEMILPRREPSAKLGQAEGQAVAPGRIVLLVGQGAFNLIAQRLLEKTHSIDEKERVLGTTVAVSSKATIERIKIRIPSKTGTARARVTFKRTQARVRVGPLRAWTPVDIKSARARVDLKLWAKEGERKGYAIFQRVDDLDVRLKQRGPFGLATSLLDEALDEVLRPVMNVLFEGRRFELLSLPKTLPGSPGFADIPVTLEFQRRGLRFWPGLAMFQLSIEPPRMPSQRPQEPRWRFRPTTQFGAATILLDHFESKGKLVEGYFIICAPANGTFTVLISDIMNNNALIYHGKPVRAGVKVQLSYPSGYLSQLLIQVIWSLNGDEVLDFAIDLTQGAGAHQLEAHHEARP